MGLACPACTQTQYCDERFRLADQAHKVASRAEGVKKVSHTQIVAMVMMTSMVEKWMGARLISSSTGRNIDRLVAKVAPITAGVGPENFITPTSGH